MDTQLELRRHDMPMELSINELCAQVIKIQEVMNKVMRKDEHYGVIPGTNKPTLLKPGAEKLCLVFRLDPQYDSLDHYDGDHLTIKSKCTLYHIPTSLRIGSGEGSCSTKESKYAFRNAQLKCPNCGKETIFKSKKENQPGYYCWQVKGGCGTQFPPNEFEGIEVGKVANDNLADQYNTVLKMANKRSLIAAVLNATAASDIFTQDLEDMAENGQKFTGQTTQTKSTSNGQTKTRSSTPNLKQALWNNILAYSHGDKSKAGNILKQLSGKQFFSELTEEEAKVVQVKFEADYLGGQTDAAIGAGYDPGSPG